MTVCARAYFQRRLEEAEHEQRLHEKKRHDSAMRIAGWRADVYRQILERCAPGLVLEKDVGVPVVEAICRKDNLFLYEGGRAILVKECAKMLVIPTQVSEECL